MAVDASGSNPIDAAAIFPNPLRDEAERASKPSGEATGPARGSTAKPMGSVCSYTGGEALVRFHGKTVGQSVVSWASGAALLVVGSCRCRGAVDAFWDNGSGLLGAAVGFSMLTSFSLCWRLGTPSAKTRKFGVGDRGLVLEAAYDDGDDDDGSVLCRQHTERHYPCDEDCDDNEHDSIGVLGAEHRVGLRCGCM